MDALPGILPPTVRPSPFAQWNVETQEQYPQEFFPRGRKDRGSIDNQSQYKVGVHGWRRAGIAPARHALRAS